jgi:DNA repair exonuclease SbcCD nuclease subunit
MRRHETTDPTTWIRNAFEEPGVPTDLPRIVLAHGTIQGFGALQDDEDESPAAMNLIDLKRLPDAQIDYIALGDWHGSQQVGPKAWYCGTPEIDRFPKGAGNDPGHILKVTLERGLNPQIEKLATGRFRWHDMTFRFSEDASLDTLAAMLDERIGTHGMDCLLRLALEGALGIETAGRLEKILESMESRLLRLKLIHQVTLAPTPEEIDALTRRADDPLVSAVAAKLVALTEGGDAEIARLALRELHTACCGRRSP